MDKEKIVNIAEKIKFWEEQDRINKAIIPRILKNHDLIVELSRKLTEYTNINIGLEVKIKNLQSKIEVLEKQKDTISELEIKEKKLQENIEYLKVELLEKLTEYKNMNTDLELKIKKLQSKIELLERQKGIIIGLEVKINNLQENIEYLKKQKSNINISNILSIIAIIISIIAIII